MKKSQLKMFEDTEEWKEHWQDMPEFNSDDLTSFNSIIVHFACREDMEEFSKLINQKLTKNTQSIWYPKAEIRSFKGKVYVTKGYKEMKHES